MHEATVALNEAGDLVDRLSDELDEALEAGDTDRAELLKADLGKALVAFNDALIPVLY